jgi:hypothetical protein
MAYGNDKGGMSDKAAPAAACAATVGPDKKYNTMAEYLVAKDGGYKDAAQDAGSAADALKQQASPKSFILKG